MQVYRECVHAPPWTARPRNGEPDQPDPLETAQRYPPVSTA